MVTRIAQHITRKLVSSAVIEESDSELYSYGFFLVISHLLFFCITIAFGFLAGVLVESAVFFLVFASLRAYAGGIHAKTETRCTFFTTLALGLSVLGLRAGSEAIAILLLILGTLAILCFAPLDTPEKPLEQEDRVHCRKCTLLLLALADFIAWGVWALSTPGIFTAVAVGVFLEGVLLACGKVVGMRKPMKNHV